MKLLIFTKNTLLLSILSVVTAVESTTTSTTQGYTPSVLPAAPISYDYDNSYITEEPSIVFPPVEPCIKTLTRTYTTVVSYAQCRPSDYESPNYNDSNHCTIYQNKTYCGGICFVYMDWIDETSLIMKTHCDTSNCKFITDDLNQTPYFNCEKTKTLDNGCLEIINQDYDMVKYRTECPTNTDTISGCVPTTINEGGIIHNVSLCPRGINVPPGCELRSTTVMSLPYLTCHDSCTRVYGSIESVTTGDILKHCPVPFSSTIGCTSINSQIYCPPSDYCYTSSSSYYYEGRGYFLIGIKSTSCDTGKCSFTSTLDYTGYDCSPLTTTLDNNGCYEIKNMEYGTVKTSTSCKPPPPTTTTTTPTTMRTALPTACSTGRYYASHVDPDDFTEYTMCPPGVKLPSGCYTTDWPYFSGEVAVTCETPCIKTITSGNTTTTISYTSCPKTNDPSITIGPTSTIYDGSCAMYNGNMTCPDHCIVTSLYEDYDDETKYLIESYSCDPKLSCSFVDYWGPSPSFSCINVTIPTPITTPTPTIPGFNKCSTSWVTTYSSPDDVSTLFTFCPCDITIPEGCQRETETEKFSYPGNIIKSCNPPCTKTFSNEIKTITITYNPCPSKIGDPEISPPPNLSIHYPSDCISYNSTITCPDHCGQGYDFQEYYGSTYIIDVYYCETDIDCTFITTDVANPSFSCD